MGNCKISILTFHCIHNYGAVLQAYAFQQYLKLIGHDVSSKLPKLVY